MGAEEVRKFRIYGLKCQVLSTETYMNKTITERDYLLQIIQDQLRRRSGFKVEDIYKMVYQATCGGDHLLSNKSKAKKMLREEWDTLDKIQKGEPLLEVIDPLGQVLRVNLRVYRKIGGAPKKMFDVFVQSAKEFKKDQRRLIRYWQIIMEMVEKGEILFSRDVLEDFLIDVGKKDFPVVHHSESYTDANRPAYRVVLKDLWEGLRESTNQK